MSQLVFMMCAAVSDTLRRACVDHAREMSRVSRRAELAFILHVARDEVLERVNVLRAVAEWEIRFRGLFNLDAHAVICSKFPRRAMRCVD